MSLGQFTDHLHSSQVDATYSYHLDRVLPRLIAVSREAGDGASCRGLRAAGLGALAAKVTASSHSICKARCKEGRGLCP